MKKIKYILVSAVILSFFFITACSTTQSVPQDDVYYSTTSHNNVTAKATAAQAVSSPAVQHQKAKQTGNSGYQQGEVENISQPTGQTTSGDQGDQYDVDYSARLKRFHQSNDTSLDYYDDHYADRTTQDTKQQNNSTSDATSSNVTLNLGFGSPYFGSSWSFGFGYPYSNWSFGLGYGWGYPYYDYGWGYPGYGWGYPYYAWGYPDYGWGYPGYGWGYPEYGWGCCYYPPYYPIYPDYGYRTGVYQPRMHRGGGSSVPRGTTGGSGIYVSPNSKSAGRSTSTVSHKRVPVNPEGRNGKMIKPGGSNSRPEGSMRFNSELAKKRLEESHSQSKLNKPGGGSAVRKNPYGNRSSKFGISESRNRAVEGYHKSPAYRREENMRPKFQKPKQYQSLESRSMRSSKEFYRSPARPSNPGYRQTGVRTVHPQKQIVRRQNVYRPATTRNSVYRGNYRSRSGVKTYSAPSRSYSSPRIFRSPASRNSSVSKPSRSYSAPTRSFTAPPVRINTGSSSGSGGGSVRRSSGSGGIRH